MIVKADDVYLYLRNRVKHNAVGSHFEIEIGTEPPMANADNDFDAW